MIKKISLFGCLLLTVLMLIFPAFALAEREGIGATRLESVYITALAEGIEITIIADGMIDGYKAFTLDQPARIVFDLPRIRSPFKKSQTIDADSEWATRVRYFGYPDKVRLVIDTQKAYLSTYTAHTQSDGLKIYVGTTAPAERRTSRDAEAFRSGAAHLESVTIDRGDESVKIAIKADGEIQDFRSFTLDNPARIVFDLFQLKSPFKKTRKLTTDSKWVKAVRYYGHPDKVRLVIDTMAPYLSAFSADPVSDGLEITVGQDPSATPSKAGVSAAAEVSVSQPSDREAVDDTKPDADHRTYGPEMEAVVASPRGAIAPSEKLTLRQIINQAIRSNIGLKSLRQGTKSALAFKKIQQTAFLPTLRATYQLQHTGEAEDDAYFLLLYGDFPPQDIYSFVGTLTQPLFAGFSLVNRYQVAKLGLNISELNEELLRQTVIFSAKQGYFSLLKAQKLLTVSQQSVELLEAHRTVANNFYQVGMIPLNDLLKAQVELANANQSFIVVRNSLNIAKSNLNLILRRDINAPIEVVDVTRYSTFDKDIDYCLQTAKDHRIEIRIADLDTRMKEREVKIARKDYYPAINLRANIYQRGDDWDVNGGNRFLDGNSWDASAVATWNFWEWGRSRQGVRAKLAGLKQSQLKRDDIFDNIRLEVKQAYLRTREGEKNITTVQKAIEQARENYRISEERYKEQMVTSTDVLDAQTLLSRTMNNYYNALYDFKISKASLYKAMGQEVME